MDFKTESSALITQVREFIRAQNRAIQEDSSRDDEFGRLALSLFAFQFKYNECFRRLCAARRCSPQSVDHWTEIPAVPAAAFKEVELSCIPRDRRTAVFHSSGTTGQPPSRHFHCPESLDVYETSLWAWFSRNVPESRTCGRVLSLTPSPAEAPHSSLVHMIETVRARLAVAGEYLGSARDSASWRLEQNRCLRTFENLALAGEPVLVLGTAFSFVELAEMAQDRHAPLALPRGSLVFETGGYKGRSRVLAEGELHELLERRLQVPRHRIVCEYGMSELSSQAYDRRAQDRWHARGESSPVFHFPPWARARILSPETGVEVRDGESGLIRVCDLANAFSVVAIQTEDLAVRRSPGFELIGRAPQAEPRGCSLMVAE